MKSQQYTYAFNYIPRLHKLDEHLCFLFPVLFLSLSNLSYLLWVWAKPGKEHIKNVLCWRRAEPLPSTSLPSKTDRHGGDTAELPSVGAGVKPGTTAPETFFFFFLVSHSFSLALLHACFPLHISPSYCCFPSLPLIFCFTNPPLVPSGP